jgi:RNA polymerase sigma factor for flagellar operon FliA
MTREAYQRLSEEAQTRSLRSLEALMETEGESASWPRRDADLDADQLQQELVTVLKDGVGKLGDRERLLLKRYYENNKTLKEIAEELGITESRVCQIHGALLIKLKVWFEGRLQEQPTASMLYHKLVRS